MQESELAVTTSSATVHVHQRSTPNSIPLIPSHHDRPGSAPPIGTGFSRSGVPTKDASVQSEPVDDLENDDNISEANSIRSARSQPEEIKVVSYNEPLAQLPPAPSTRSLDGSERLNYRGAVLNPSSKNLHPSSARLPPRQQHSSPIQGGSQGSSQAPLIRTATYYKRGGGNPISWERSNEEYDENNWQQYAQRNPLIYKNKNRRGGSERSYPPSSGVTRGNGRYNGSYRSWRSWKLDGLVMLKTWDFGEDLVGTILVSPKTTSRLPLPHLWAGKSGSLNLKI